MTALARLVVADRLAPIVAGLAGLAWFWAELTPQRFGFPDTDNPAVGLAFVAAHPEAWQLAGLALAVAAFALVATVLTLADRLADGGAIGPRALTAIGLIAAAFLLGMAAVRLAGGPVLYVQGLSQAWGEAAYLVTQFVGIQLLGVAGLSLLSIWIIGVAWTGGRRGLVPRALAVLAVLPGLRLLGTPGLPEVLRDGLWLLYLAAIPATFLWLVLLGAWPRARRVADRLARDVGMTMVDTLGASQRALPRS